MVRFAVLIATSSWLTGACDEVFDLDRVEDASSDAGWGDGADGQVTRTFQRDVDGYTGVQDTSLVAMSPNTSYGTAVTISWELEQPDETFALIRFGDLFGTAPGQIPRGAIIVDATLSLYAQNKGDPAEVHEIKVSWQEASTTYNTFGTDVGAQALVDYESATVAIVEPPTSAAVYTIAVTSSVSSWSQDPSANQGWIFVPTSTNAAVITSSEAGIPIRPQLSVSYLP